MRVAMFTPTWGKTVGGTAKVARGLVAALCDLVPDVQFYIYSPDVGAGSERSVTYRDGRIICSALLFAFVDMCRFKPNVIHCQGRIHQLLVGYLYKKLVDKTAKTIISFYTQPTFRSFLNESLPKAGPFRISVSWLKDRLAIFLLNCADTVVANSASLAENLKIQYGSALKCRINVIPSGVEKIPSSINDSAYFKEKYGLGQSSPIFLSVGVFSWDWKVAGLLLLLDAFCSVSAQLPAAKLVIVGDGRYSDVIRNKIDELSIGHKVVLTGNLPNTFIPLAATDIYCHMALNESSSVSIIEAMVAGKPTIVSRAGGNTELISDKETGLVVASNPEELAEAMLSLARDPSLSEKLGKAASAAAKNYDWKNIAAQYLIAYRQN